MTTSEGVNTVMSENAEGKKRRRVRLERRIKVRVILYEVEAAKDSDSASKIDADLGRWEVVMDNAPFCAFQEALNTATTS